MTRKEIIDGLKFTIEMFLLDPSTGETITEPRNNMDKTTIDACKGAIELLEQTDGDLISREEAVECCFNGWNKDFNEIAEDIKKLPAYPTTFKPIAEIKIDSDEVAKKVLEEIKNDSAEQTYDWCKGCKEYDTEKHCCHRYSSFIRESLQENINAVLEDIKAEIEQVTRFGNAYQPIEHGLLMSIIDKHISGKEDE